MAHHEALRPEVRSTVLSLLDAGSVDGLTQHLRGSLGDFSQNEVTKLILLLIIDEMASSLAKKGLAFVSELSAAILALPQMKTITFSNEYYSMTAAVAQCCVAQKAYAEAQVADVTILDAPPNAVSSMDASLRLRSCIRLLNTSSQTMDTSAADLAKAKGMPLYRAILHNIKNGVSDQKELACQFLEALGNSSQHRHLFGEASRAFNERYQLVGAAADLETSIICALLSSAGPARVAQMALLALAPEAKNFGELWTVLQKANQSHLLRHSDAAALAARAPLVPSAFIEGAVSEHNIHAISKIYENISFSTLSKLLGGLGEDAVAELVACMIADKRLQAQVDQYARCIFFGARDSDVAFSEWDGQIGAACSALTQCADMIAIKHPQIANLIQASD